MREHEMVADSMWRLPDNVLRRFFGVKGNSYPAVAALITREKSLLGGQGPFSRWVGNARISADIFWDRDGNPHKSFPSRYSHRLQRPCHGHLGGNREG